MKTCCVTGHRPNGFPWNYYNKMLKQNTLYINSLKNTVLTLIKSGYINFICGGAIGVDLDFAKTIVQLRNTLYPFISLEIAVPCPEQDYKWSDDDKSIYRLLLSAANRITTVSDKYTSTCMQKRNEYMVNNSDIVLAVYNGKNKGGTYNTLNYAKKNNKKFIIINLNDFI